MTDFINLFSEQLIATSFAEWCAVILAISYLLLAVKESIWCWPAAFVSTSIYAVLFYDVSLYMESLLNLYYLLMALYGFYQWRYNKQGETVKPIIQWRLKTHLVLIVSLSLVATFNAYLLEKYTDQTLPYLDSFTTWFAVVVTYMVAQKVLENWHYWMVINSASIYMYFQKGFALTVVLLVSYLVIAVFGWLKWRQHLKQQSLALNA
jgi:nicotinamide mononucleotide transporter